MSMQEIVATAKALMAEGCGILAMDESINTCDRRFEALGIPQTIEMRRDYKC
jgi:fructose-bisphosphate aldolase class I